MPKVEVVKKETGDKDFPVAEYNSETNQATCGKPIARRPECPHYIKGRTAGCDLVGRAKCHLG